MAKVLYEINRWMHHIILALAEIALAAMAIIVIMTVILRFFFSTGIAWAEEVPRLLVGYFAFLSCALGVRDRDHIGMDFVYNLFPKNGAVRAAIDFFADFCVLLCGVFMFYCGGDRILRMMSLSGALPITQWPNWVRYAAFPVAGFAIIFTSVLFLTRVIKPDDKLFTEAEVDYEEEYRKMVKGGKLNGQ